MGVVQRAAPPPPAQDETDGADGSKGGRLSRVTRLWRGAACAAILLAPVLLTPGVPALTQLIAAGLAGVAFLAILAVARRGASFPPPPVIDVGYLAILAAGGVAIAGMRMLDRTDTLPAIFGEIHRALNVPYGPVWVSDGLGPELSAIHAAVLATSVAVTVAGAMLLLAMRWPAPRHRLWAEAWGDVQRRWGRRRRGLLRGGGAVQFALLALVSLYFPLDPDHFGEAFEVPGLLTPGLGAVVLITLKAAAFSLNALLAVAVLRARGTGARRLGAPDDVPGALPRTRPREIHPIVWAQMQQEERERR